MRSQRLLTDKFAHISEIWNKFIENCKACYRPGDNITIDEQLFPTKARCPFTQYIASKPDKFGIKFWLATDTSSKYLVNGFPYLGKDDTRPKTERLADNVVLNLSAPYLNRGRNITTDNFFYKFEVSRSTEEKKYNISWYNKSC